jgi:LmbE family N-acetylglucosaminyl deacetylase
MAGDPSSGDLGSILGVFAHPDDEAYLAGALMAVAVDAGRRVVCVTATRGELGFPDDDPRSIDERKALRTAEMEACLAVLGVEEHRWLDYPDAGCADVPIDEPVARLRAIVDEVRPDTVLTFGPDGGTFHDDHITVGQWTTLACRAASWQPRLLYSTNTPEWIERFTAAVAMDGVMMSDAEPAFTSPEDLAVCFVADDAIAERKASALRKQASQVEALVRQAGEDVFLELMRDEFYRDPTPHDWPA